MPVLPVPSVANVELVRGFDLADRGQKTKDRGWLDRGQRTARKPSFVLCLMSFLLSGLMSHVRAPVSASPAADQRAGG